MPSTVLNSAPARAFRTRLRFFVTPFDWTLLIERNFIDLGVVAHRNGLEGLAFDEELPQGLEDWDYNVKLAARYGIEPLPVLASFYTTDAPSRITGSRFHGTGDCRTAASVSDAIRYSRQRHGV